MRCVPVLLAILLTACGQQPAEDLAATLAADPVRLKALRAQCAADRQAAGEDTCRAAAEAFRRRFFAGHGIADYRIVESLGATEGAPAAAAADLIVDITSTGATLRANGLKVLADGVILKSQACLVASRAVELGERQTRALETIAARVKGAV